MNPNDAHYFDQAIGLAQSGQKADAYAQFKNLLKVNNNQINPNLLMWIVYTTPDLGEADYFLQRMSEIEPNSPNLANVRSWLEGEKAKSGNPSVEPPAPPQQQSSGSIPIYQPLQAAPDYSTNYQQPPASYQTPPGAAMPLYQQQPSGYYPPPNQPYYAQPNQPPYYAPTGQPVYAPPTNVVVVNTNQGAGCLVRGIWFLFIGWWLGFFWMYIGWALCATIIFLPVGLMMLNTVPGVLTLRPRNTHVKVSHDQYGNTTVTAGNTPQYSFLIRAVYFVFLGLWLSLIWCTVAYLCFAFLITIPVGIVMLDRLPFIITLKKN
jgi:uncharacterized membrane protein YccF (DUF307 family)